MAQQDSGSSNPTLSQENSKDHKGSQKKKKKKKKKKEKNEIDPTKRKTYQVRRIANKKRAKACMCQYNIHLLLNVFHRTENRMFNFKI